MIGVGCKMNYRIFSFIVIAVMLIFCSACKKDQFEVDPPAYIQIDSFTVMDDCFGHDDNRMKLISHKITDAWVLIDGHLQGVYELPVKFPVIAEGTHKIEVRPGIKQNGISATRAVYPFYEFYTNTVRLDLAKTTRVDPCVAFRPTGLQSGNLKVAWKEDFEGVVDLQYHENSDVQVETVSGKENVVEGNFSGGIFLSGNEDFFEMISPRLTGLPTFGNPIYLELNYRTNHDFFVGLYAQDRSVQQNLYGFKAQNSWNKVYIDLSEPVRILGNFSNFNIFIGFVKNPDIDSVNMFIDNIKLLHF